MTSTPKTIEARVIKFRGFNTSANTMYPPEHFAFRLDGVVLQLMDTLQNGDTSWAPSQGSMVFMQFTGLIDANGRDVYEGDLLRVTNLFTRRSVITRVWWNGETARFNGIPTSNVNVFEVIGNIYENPDLLTDPTGKKP